MSRAEIRPGQWWKNVDQGITYVVVEANAADDRGPYGLSLDDVVVVKSDQTGTYTFDRESFLREFSPAGLHAPLPLERERLARRLACDAMNALRASALVFSDLLEEEGSSEADDLRVFFKEIESREVEYAPGGDMYDAGIAILRRYAKPHFYLSKGWSKAGPRQWYAEIKIWCRTPRHVVATVRPKHEGGKWLPEKVAIETTDRNPHPSRVLEIDSGLIADVLGTPEAHEKNGRATVESSRKPARDRGYPLHPGDVVARWSGSARWDGTKLVDPKPAGGVAVSKGWFDELPKTPREMRERGWAHESGHQIATVVRRRCVGCGLYASNLLNVVSCYVDGESRPHSFEEVDGRGIAYGPKPA